MDNKFRRLITEVPEIIIRTRWLKKYPRRWFGVDPLAHGNCFGDELIPTGSSFCAIRRSGVLITTGTNLVLTRIVFRRCGNATSVFASQGSRVNSKLFTNF